MVMQSVSLASVADTLPLEWKYISEGGATIVFSYVGPPDAQFDGMVLRLRKCRLGRRTYDSDVTDEPDDATIIFQRKCMERLIPPQHLPRLVSVSLNESWLTAFSEAHNSERPKERRAVDEIDTSRKKGVLATDLIGSQGLSVEIKPKWGFLPPATHLSTTTTPVKTRTCRFCMHAHLKALQDDKDVSVGYCPLDLYSGNPDRVRTALESLWEAWMRTNGSVNNLKVFVAGRMVKPDSIYELKQALLPDVDAHDAPTTLRETFISSLLSLLLDTPVLRILANLQRTLDVLDIEGLSTLWHRTLVQFADPVADPETPLSPLGQTSSIFESPDPTIEDWSAFIDQYLTSASTTDTTSGVPGLAMNHKQPLTSNLRYYLMAYLLSATFKDCSIIYSSVADPHRKGTATIIDLDPKSMERLRKWERLDAQIALTYADLDEQQRKTCIYSFSET